VFISAQFFVQTILRISYLLCIIVHKYSTYVIFVQSHFCAMDRNEIKIKLDNLLPRGFAKTIQEKFVEANATPPSLSWISKVCSKKTKHWDADIIGYALQIAAEQKVKETDLLSKAASI
jgi:hypothetical protein